MALFLSASARGIACAQAALSWLALDCRQAITRPPPGVTPLQRRLRTKLDAASPGSNLITTVRNGGYLFTASVKQVS